MRIFPTSFINKIIPRVFKSVAKSSVLKPLEKDVVQISSSSALSERFKLPLSKIEEIGGNYSKSLNSNISLAEKDNLMAKYSDNVKKAISDAVDLEKTNKQINKEFIHDCNHQATGSFLTGQQMQIRFIDATLPLSEQHNIADKCAKTVVDNVNKTCRRYQFFLDKKMDSNTSTIGADKVFQMVKEDFIKKAEAKNIKLITEGENLLKEYSQSTHSDYKNYIIESNLLANAIKYSPENSVIKMGFKIEENDKHLRFFINDHGIGVPGSPDVQRRILYGERASNVGNIPGEGHGLYRTNAFVNAATGEEIKVTSPLYPNEVKYKGTMFECPIVSDITKKFMLEQ